jgi:hypothetical protein
MLSAGSEEDIRGIFVPLQVGDAILLIDIIPARLVTVDLLPGGGTDERQFI